MSSVAVVMRFLLLILLLFCSLQVLTREVVSPKRPDLVLSADIPDVEARVLVRDGLDVESDGRDGVDFAGGARGELKGVEDGFKKCDC
jgi:hypothetical protein